MKLNLSPDFSGVAAVCRRSNLSFGVSLARDVLHDELVSIFKMSFDPKRPIVRSERQSRQRQRATPQIGESSFGFKIQVQPIGRIDSVRSSPPCRGKVENVFCFPSFPWLPFNIFCLTFRMHLLHLDLESTLLSAVTPPLHLATSVSDQIDEEAVDAAVRGKLRVKRRRHEFALPHTHRKPIALS